MIPIYIQQMTPEQTAYYTQCRALGHARITGGGTYEEQYLKHSETYRKLQPYQFIKPTDHIIQCGFCFRLVEWGVSQPLILSTLAEKVTAFDPDPKNVKDLKEYVNKYNIKNIEIINKAVWKTNGKMGFHFFGTHQNIAAPIVRKYWNSIHEEGKGGKRVEVDAISLDSYLAGNKIDFINMTVNGSEGPILEGLRKTFDVNPHLNISVVLKTKNNWLYDVRWPVLKKLQDRGYKLAVSNSPRAWVDETFLYAVATKETDEELESKGFTKATDKNIKELLGEKFI